MAKKGLFTSLEEIIFQDVYVNGHVKKVRESNAGRNPVVNKMKISKKRNVRAARTFLGKTR